ncbi:hypothetical protein EMCRGX_G028564 [Ephydatia muelleri]
MLGSTKERFGPFACNLVRLARCSWKLLSAVLAVSVDNESHTAENIATLLKECSEVRYQMGTRLDSITTDNGANFKAAVQQLLDEDVTEENPATLWKSSMTAMKCQLLKPLREISVFFEGEKYPTVSGVSRLITTLNATLNSEGPPSSWNLGVREWDELPSEVYECFLSLKTGFKTRFNPSSFLLTNAALVHPGHKSLSWLEPTRREEAIQQFKDELLIVAGIEALDAFFDFDSCTATKEILLGVANRSTRDCIEEEFKRYMLELQTNWRVNDVMQWWSDHEANFPHIALLALKYLAIPASSAPSERAANRQTANVTVLVKHGHCSSVNVTGAIRHG